jgi:hypothetical protein
MKMIKHSHEESTGNMEIAQGALLGLVVENCLEITNCFPFPKHNDENMDEGNECVVLICHMYTTVIVVYSSFNIRCSFLSYFIIIYFIIIIIHSCSITATTGQGQ